MEPRSGWYGCAERGKISGQVRGEHAQIAGAWNPHAASRCDVVPTIFRSTIGRDPGDKRCDGGRRSAVASPGQVRAERRGKGEQHGVPTNPEIQPRERIPRLRRRWRQPAADDAWPAEWRFTFVRSCLCARPVPSFTPRRNNGSLKSARSDVGARDGANGKRTKSNGLERSTSGRPMDAQLDQ